MKETILAVSVEAIAAIAFIFGLYRFRIMDMPSRIIAILLGISLLVEGLALIFSRMFHNNMPVYNIYSLVELFLISLYFNYTIDVFAKYNIGIYIGIAGIVMGIINFCFLQPLNTLNSYFLLFEGFCIIGMALFSFFRLLLKYEKLRLHTFPHFWFTTLFLLYWSTTYLNWGVYDILIAKLHHQIWIVNLGLAFISIANYIGLGIVFLLYPKLRTVNE